MSSRSGPFNTYVENVNLSMSCCGGFGRGGRGGRGKKRTPEPQKASKESEDKNKKFSIPSKRNDNQHSYESVKKQLEREVRMMANVGIELGELIAEEKEYTFSTIAPLAPTATQKADEFEMAMLKKQQEIDMEELSYKKMEYNNGKSSVCALIQEKYVTPGLLQKLEREPNFDQMKTSPLVLLKSIREVMHSTGEKRKNFEVVWDQLAAIMAVKQQHDENLNTYTERFRTQMKILKLLLGTDLFDHAVKNSPAYKNETDATIKAQMVKDGFKNSLAVLFIRNADRSKYGSFLQQRRADFGDNRDSYPEDVATALERLDIHQWDPTYAEQQKKRKQQQQKKKDSDETNQASMAQQKGGGSGKRCHCCGSESHLLPACPVKGKIPTDDWFNKTGKVPALVSAAQHEKSNESDKKDDGGNSKETKTSWHGKQGTSGCQQFAQQSHHDDVIVLDCRRT